MATVSQENNNTSVSDAGDQASGQPAKRIRLDAEQSAPSEAVKNDAPVVKESTNSTNNPSIGDNGETGGDKIPKEPSVEVAGSSGMNVGSSSGGDNEADKDAKPESIDLDSTIQKALEDIDSCQNEIDLLNEKASEEILKVEQKYNKLRKPFFDKRNELIQNIPNFWVTAFVNHPTLTTILEEEEEECLHHLTKLEVEEFEDIKSGYKIIFHFEKNEYFDNDALVKEFHLGSSGDPTSTSTPINWKKTEQAERLKAQSVLNRAQKRRKRKRCIAPETFFTWYLQNGDASVDDVAEVIKDDLWPNPLQYFLVSEMDENNGLEDSDEEGDDADVVVVDSEDEDDSDLDPDSEEYEEDDNEEVQDA
ncbi:NAP domain-containing protein SET [Brevipalpus obovatus]|uniref:NAP domain-containing protein SET n=1 Tax=Brevipalpus obovatus TaxID=246614 RepID=UPI003D9E079E